MAEIAFTRLLDPQGHLSGELPDFAHNTEPLIAAYRAMVLTRSFDTKAIALQRTGQLGTYASSLGQEAVGVGVARAMRANDVLLPSFREHGAQLLRGVAAKELFLFWGGDERGTACAKPYRDFPNCIPVGSHASHAAGVALALKLEGESGVAVTVFGDGATSKGDAYEAMNLAGVWKLPVLFVICNNQWAISMPRSAQTAAESLAQKAFAVGFHGEQVDGNDVIAVEAVVRRALERIRAGHGPHVIEAVTYRMSDHTTSDDARRYRSDDVVSQQWKFDPIARLRSYLGEIGAWTAQDEETLLDDCRQQIKTAAEEYLATSPQDPATIFDFTYEELPPDLRAQRSAFLSSGGGNA